jgi:hypothetical protein
MKVPPFFEAARRHWRRQTETDEARQQAGLAALTVVEKQYQLTDQHNLYQQIAELEQKLRVSQGELMQERLLAIKRSGEHNQLTKQLERIPQLEHDLAQRDEQECQRLGQWLQLAGDAGLFAVQTLPKLAARMSERQHRLQQRQQVLNVQRGLVGSIARGQRARPHGFPVP